MQQALSIGPASIPASLSPYELFIERDHPFKVKGPDPDTGKKRIGCAVCGRGKLNVAHLGAPPSLNSGGSGMDRMAYQSLKKAWQQAFAERLEDCGLPKGLKSVTVEGLVGFPTLKERDQGNYRWMIEKALGDALEEGGWLQSDCFFPVLRYEFGGLQAVHAKNESWLRLVLFPVA